MTPTLQRRLLVTALASLLILPAVKTQAAGTLRIAREQDSTTFDPIMSQQNADCWIFPNIFAPIVKANEDATAIEPSLAESWTVSPDNLTYTFTLRSGLKFSDGSPLRASDVRFTILRARDTKESAWAALYSGIADVIAKDDRTVVFQLKAPSAVFLANIAMFAAAIVPEAAFTRMGEEAFAQKPVSSGAFQVAEWKHGDRVVLAKNPHFWNAGNVSLDRVEWILIPNDNTRILKLQGKEVDGAIIIPFNRIAELQKAPGIEVHLDPSTREDHLLLNQARPSLGNRDVRRAIHMAIDRKAIVDAVTFGQGTIANSFIPKGALFYNPDNKDYSYDPAKAKQMLDQAGVSNLKLGLLIFSGDSAHEQIATLLKDQLGKVGIDVSVQKQEPSQAFDTTVAGEYDLALNYWTNDIIDPDQKTTFSVYGDDVSKSFYTGYHNSEVRKLVDESRAELSATKRRDIYYNIQMIVKEDVHWIDLYYSPFRNITASYVKSFKQNPLGGFSLENVSINSR